MSDTCRTWVHGLRSAVGVVLAVALNVGFLGEITTADAAMSSHQITAVDAKTWLVTAKEAAARRPFQGKIHDARMLSASGGVSW